MKSNPSGVKIERDKVHKLTTFLKAQHYFISWRFNSEQKEITKGTINIDIIRGEEHHYIKFFTEKDDFTHYTYVSSKIINVPMSRVVQKYLGLDLEVEYPNSSQEISHTQLSSQTFTKQMLDAISEELIQKDYLIVWDYPADKIDFLIGGDEDDCHMLTFVRKNDHLVLHSAYVTDLEVKEIIEKHSNVSIKLQKEYKPNKVLKMEIDYHLMELYDFIQEDDKVNINKVKNILKELQEQLEDQMQEI